MQGFAERLKASGFGWLVAAVGLFIAIFAPLNPEGAHAPMWVIEAAASAFLLAGLSLVFQAFNAAFLARLCGLGVAYMLATPGLWMLFDGEGARCSASIAFFSFAIDAGAGSVACRAVFGFGGLLTLAFALLMTWAAFRKRHTRPGQSPTA